MRQAILTAKVEVVHRDADALLFLVARHQRGLVCFKPQPGEHSTALTCQRLDRIALGATAQIKQGGMAVGKVPQGSTVYFDDKPIRVSPEGVFVIGFSRDAKAKAMLKVHHPAGDIESHPLLIEQREYKIQRIDGLPPRKVTRECPWARASGSRTRHPRAMSWS